MTPQREVGMANISDEGAAAGLTVADLARELSSAAEIDATSLGGQVDDESEADVEPAGSALASKAVNNGGE